MQKNEATDEHAERIKRGLFAEAFHVREQTGDIEAARLLLWNAAFEEARRFPRPRK
jgi:hypothetical protein